MIALLTMFKLLGNGSLSEDIVLMGRPLGDYWSMDH